MRVVNKDSVEIVQKWDTGIEFEVKKKVCVFYGLYKEEKKMEFITVLYSSCMSHVIHITTHCLGAFF